MYKQSSTRVKIAAYISPVQAEQLERLRVALDLSMSSLIGLIITLGLPRVMALTEMPVKEAAKVASQSLVTE